MANYLDKSNIERQPLKNNFLKRVIIRFDFTSIVNMQSVLDNIVAYLQSLKESFGSDDNSIIFFSFSVFSIEVKATLSIKSVFELIL